MCASVFAWAKTDTRAPLERPRYLRGAYIMNHKKLLLTLTLCLCALLCMVVTVSADEPHANHYSCGVVNCQNNDHGHTQVTEWKGWDGTSEIVYTEGTAYIYLTRDVTFDQIFQISSGNTLYLCLNGKKIEMQGENNVLAANSGSKLVLCDCQRNGSITHGVDNNGKKAEGGGVNVSGTFVMYSGTISDNMTGDYYYGAVTVNNGAVFKMYGGSISGNQCISTGGAGGVYVYGGTFEMYGGTITDNTYIQDDWSGGGGVSVNSAGTFTMSGGTITNNTASGNAKSGGGVYFSGRAFNVSGNITITGNTKNGTANNVFLSGEAITVIGSLTGSPIGVTTSNTPNKDNRYCTYFDFAKASSADLLVKNKFAYENDSAIYIGTYTNNGITYLRACAHKDSSFRYEKTGSQHWQECSDCGYEGTKTDHIYSQKKMTDTYKASDATCTNPVTYYYSCVCGAKGTNIFNSTKTNEQAKGHAYVDHAAKDPTCTEDGWAAYKTCERCDYTTKVEKQKTPHTYGAVSYTWATDNTTCKAEHKCTACQHVENETVNTQKQVTQNHSCTLNELSTFTATFTNTAFAQQTKENVTTADMTGHSYGTPTYVWAANNDSCTATRTCTACQHVENETVNTQQTVTQNRSCTLNELSTFTATFTNTAFAQQTKENVTTADMTGHSYGGTWVKGQDGHWKVCEVCQNQSEVKPHTWKDATYTAPKTCTVCGATQGEPLTRSYYYYAPSAAENKKDSPKTADPGVLLYAGLALASLTGLACTAKKRH